MAELVSIVDYGSGNLRSVQKAFERAADGLGKVIEVDVTSDPERVRNSDRIVLPGVGAFADCRSGLDAVTGMVEVLHETVREKAVPFFGICVGMQLMSEIGREKLLTGGLGWIRGEVIPIDPAGGLKVPQIGWNILQQKQDHPLLDGMELGENGLHAYFVHSYQFRAAESENVIAVTDYGGEVTAMIGRENMVGTQFHPEKSQRLGLGLIARFLEWRP